MLLCSAATVSKPVLTPTAAATVSANNDDVLLLKSIVVSYLLCVDFGSSLLHPKIPMRTFLFMV
jgi:uncharacterized membrane protein